MINDVKTDAEQRMTKSIEAFKNELSKIRTGRAHPSLLEHISIKYYDVDTPLNQVANVSVGDGRTLVIGPYEKHLIPEIEKAILNSDLGLNPTNTGDVIRVPMPPLTEERRKELIKVVRSEAEQARVSVRNIRRDAIATLKDLLKEKEIAEDDERKAEDMIQKVTDSFVKQIDDLLSQKEEDLLEV